VTFKARVVEQYEFDAKVYILEPLNSRFPEALNLANNIFESGLVEFAEPDMYLFVEPLTNDPYHNNQWALNNTGFQTVDADIDAPEAWQISGGCSSVRIAVIDEGVQLNHPDLSANMLAGYDATGQGSAGAPWNSDGHGTAVAGIIAAVANNGIGVAGVAYNCKISAFAGVPHNVPLLVLRSFMANNP
jgi:subtilisin family serine protease